MQEHIDDYLVPSYLLNVYSKPDGWVEIPETDPDADAEFESIGLRD